eukprot:s466_g18.t1
MKRQKIPWCTRLVGRCCGGLCVQEVPVRHLRFHFFPPDQGHLGPITMRTISEMADVEDVSVIGDPSSDATVIPSKYASCGKPVRSFRRAQGLSTNVIDTCGIHEFSFVVHILDGQPINFRDLGYLLNAVSSLLLSLGRLFQHGWAIGSHDGLPSLHHSSKELTVPLNFKNASCASWVLRCIWHVHEVTTLAADILRAHSWREFRPGWNSASGGLPIC